jgi:diguanylate cyclase (GGDEF)-like protein
MLKGLPNSLAGDVRLQSRLQPSANAERVLGAAFVDIDHFKAMNNDCGHPVGDRELVEIA